MVMHLRYVQPGPGALKSAAAFLEAAMRKTSTAILALLTLISFTTAFGQQPKAQEQSATKVCSHSS